MTTLSNAIRDAARRYVSLENVFAWDAIAETVIDRQRQQPEALARLVARLTGISEDELTPAWGRYGNRNVLTVRRSDDTYPWRPRGRRRELNDEFPICQSADEINWDEWNGWAFADEWSAGYSESEGRNISSLEASDGNWFSCDVCGEFLHGDNYAGDGRCSSCRHEDEDEDEDEDETVIHSYSTNVLNIRGHVALTDSGEFSNIGTRLVFGVELETAINNLGRTDIARRLCARGERFAELAICKEDGSVTGPEIVTLPATLAAHANVIPWDNWLSLLREGNAARGHNGGDGIGFHVHVNREALSPLTVGKLMLFVNNWQANRSMWERIAQRSANRWCEFLTKSWSNARIADGSRYQALNDTGRTIEFRIFRASLKAERIRKNIEAVHAAIRYCESASAKELTGRGFLSFVRARRADYPNLSTFIRERGITA